MSEWVNNQANKLRRLGMEEYVGCLWYEIFLSQRVNLEINNDWIVKPGNYEEDSLSLRIINIFSKAYSKMDHLFKYNSTRQQIRNVEVYDLVFLIMPETINIVDVFNKPGGKKPHDKKTLVDTIKELVGIIPAYSPQTA